MQPFLVGETGIVSLVFITIITSIVIRKVLDFKTKQSGVYY